METTPGTRSRSSEWTIRDFQSSDYQGITDIHNSVFPDMPVSAEYYVDLDKRRHPKFHHRRWVVVQKECIVATGLYTQFAFKYESQTIDIWAIVRPESQGQGIGSALYDTVVTDVQSHKPDTLRVSVREDHPRGIRLLEHRGFVEFIRGGESHLDVTSFDPEPYAGLEDRLRRDGIDIKTLRELKIDPDRNRKLYELDWEVTRDEPGSVDDTRVDFDTFIRDGINSSYRLQDGYFVAVHGNEYVGLCLLNKYQGDRSLEHGITGVRRAWRNKGIATALKVRAALFAKTHGYHKIKTGNEVNNQPILSINRKLGFVPQKEWIGFKKEVTT